METKLRALCAVDDISPRSGIEVVVEGPNGRCCIALFRTGAEVHAYVNSCPHQGRSLNWAPDEFLVGDDGLLVCPHHGASFVVATGACVDGPCKGAALAPVTVTVRDGTVYLATP